MAVLNKAEREYEKAEAADAADQDLRTMQHNLLKQYQKLWMMDVKHVIILDGQDGEADREVKMTVGQIRRNDELKKKVRIPINGGNA